MTHRFNDRAAQTFAGVLGSMRFFWAAAAFQALWMLGMMLLRGPDMYPFAFLLFLSNIIQFFALPVLQNTGNRQIAALQQALTHMETLLERIDTTVEHEEQELVVLEATHA